MRAILPRKAQVLARVIKPLAEDAQPRVRVATDADHFDAAGGAQAGNLVPAWIVKVHDGNAIFGQHAGEQAHLGVKIRLEGVVIVQMVLREVGKARRMQHDAVKAALV